METSCYKHRHDSPEAAREHIISIKMDGRSRFDRGGELDIYECDVCGGYHIGHQNRPNKKKNRQPYERNRFKDSRRQKRFRRKNER